MGGILSYIQSIATTESQKNNVDSNCYPFVSDLDTINHIKKSPVMFIMRGPPGCGKSTVVHKLKSIYESAVVCSADDFFYDENGVYRHSVEKLGDAHAACQSKASDAVSTGQNPVVIDNTNIRHWEMKHYFALASRFGYSVILVFPCTPWAFDVDELEKRNTHGATAELLRNKIDSFQAVLPVFWAWFLNIDDSKRLLEPANESLKACCECYPEFEQFLRHNFHLPSEPSISFGDHYFLGGPSTKILHCTTLFAGYKNNDDAVLDYDRSECVRRSMGKSTQLAITGIIITRRTVSARVRLTAEQLELFQRDHYDAGSKRRLTAVTNGMSPDSRSNTPNKSETRNKKRKRSPRQVVTSEQSPAAEPIDPQDRSELQSEAITPQETAGTVITCLERPAEAAVVQNSEQSVDQSDIDVTVDQSDIEFTLFNGADSTETKFGTPVEIVSLSTSDNSADGLNDDISHLVVDTDSITVLANGTTSTCQQQEAELVDGHCSNGTQPTESHDGSQCILTESVSENVCLVSEQTDATKMQPCKATDTVETGTFNGNIVTPAEPSLEPSPTSTHSQVPAAPSEEQNPAVTSQTHPEEVSITTLAPTSEEDILANAGSLPAGSRAHVTLGCTKSAQAYEAGLDLLDVLTQELNEKGTVMYMANGSRVCHYGEGRCAIWFEAPLLLNALFTGKY